MRAFLMPTRLYYIKLNILFLIIHPDKKVYIAKFANILNLNHLVNCGIKNCKWDI